MKTETSLYFGAGGHIIHTKPVSRPSSHSLMTRKLHITVVIPHRNNPIVQTQTSFSYVIKTYHKRSNSWKTTTNKTLTIHINTTTLPPIPKPDIWRHEHDTHHVTLMTPTPSQDNWWSLSSTPTHDTLSLVWIIITATQPRHFTRNT